MVKFQPSLLHLQILITFLFQQMMLLLLIPTYATAVCMVYHCLMRLCPLTDQAQHFLPMVVHHMHQYHTLGKQTGGTQVTGELVCHKCIVLSMHAGHGCGGR